MPPAEESKSESKTVSRPLPRSTTLPAHLRFARRRSPRLAAENHQAPRRREENQSQAGNGGIASLPEGQDGTGQNHCRQDNRDESSAGRNDKAAGHKDNPGRSIARHDAAAAGSVERWDSTAATGNQIAKDGSGCKISLKRNAVVRENVPVGGSGAAPGTSREVREAPRKVN
jgi:hypothetical protein